MQFISIRSVRYRWPLFAGAAIALCMGALLIGLAALALAATGQVDTTGGPTVTVGSGDAQQVIARDAPDMGGIQTILVLAGVISGFMSIFMIASTFAFNVTLRNRDLGLLRLMGASGWQVRRMVLGEALIMALPAAFIGCVLAALLAPPMLHILNGTGLTPVPIPSALSIVPLLFTFGVSLLIAVLGAFAASRRAARIAPLAALQEASVDAKKLGAGRWIFGLLALVLGVLMLALAPNAGEGSTPLAIFGGIAATLAAAILGIWYMPRLAYVMALPLRWFTKVSGRITAAGLLIGRRRTSSLIAPVLVIVAIVGTLTSVLLTTGAAIIANQQSHLRSQLVATSTGTSLVETDVAALRKDNRVAAVYAPAGLPLVIVHTQDAFERQDAAVEQPVNYAGAYKVAFTDRSMRQLGENQVAVSKEYAGWNNLRIGSTIELRLFDGRLLKPEVAAIMDAGAGTPVIMVPPALAGPQVLPAGQAYLTVKPGFPSAVGNDLPVNESFQITNLREQASQADSEQAKLNVLVLIVLAGPASIYALIAISNTLVMSYSQRGRELTNMRLLGLQYGQLQRLVIWESVITVITGIIIAGGIITAALMQYHQALVVTYGAAPVTVAWQALIPLAIACLVTALATGLLAVRKLARIAR